MAGFEADVKYCVSGESSRKWFFSIN